MNLDRIEDVIVPSLKRLLGRKVAVVQGPLASPKLGGMQPMVFVHAAAFEDDGAGERRPVREGRYRGFAEERPGRIVVEVSCLSAAYATMKDLCTAISPQVLRSLEYEREFEVGQLPNRTVRLAFRDFTAGLARSDYVRVDEGEVSYHLARLEFHLEGFLHVTVTRRGRLKRK